MNSLYLSALLALTLSCKADNLASLGASYYKALPEEAKEKLSHPLKEPPLITIPKRSYVDLPDKETMQMVGVVGQWVKGKKFRFKFKGQF